MILNISIHDTVTILEVSPTTLNAYDPSMFVIKSNFKRLNPNYTLEHLNCSYHVISRSSYLL